MSPFEKNRILIGGLLIVASLALGAGLGETPSSSFPSLPSSESDAPLVARMDAAPIAEPPIAEQPIAEPPIVTAAAQPVADAPRVDAAVEEVLLVLEGSASWYSDVLAGRPTASGEPYDPTAFVAAHRALPFGTRLRVTNLSNGKSVEVRVVDRGPFVAGRVVDLSRAAAERIDMLRAGHVRVRIEVLEYGA